MEKQGFIYSNIHLYRFLMNILYAGSYRQRFDPVIRELEILKPGSVLEFCFGDIYIANYCNHHNISWRGMDINEAFVSNALKAGYKAEVADVKDRKEFPPADVCIITGSLYHFQQAELVSFLEKIFISSGCLIISEPVVNLTSSKGILGRIAGRLSRTKLGEEPFRYNSKSLTDTLNNLTASLHFTFRIIGQFKKDMVIIAEKKTSLL